LQVSKGVPVESHLTTRCDRLVWTSGILFRRHQWGNCQKWQARRGLVLLRIPRIQSAAWSGRLLCS